MHTSEFKYEIYVKNHVIASLTHATLTGVTSYVLDMAVSARGCIICESRRVPVRGGLGVVGLWKGDCRV